MTKGNPQLTDELRSLILEMLHLSCSIQKDNNNLWFYKQTRRLLAFFHRSEQDVKAVCSVSSLDAKLISSFSALHKTGINLLARKQKADMYFTKWVCFCCVFLMTEGKETTECITCIQVKLELRSCLMMAGGFAVFYKLSCSRLHLSSQTEHVQATSRRSRDDSGR